MATLRFDAARFSKTRITKDGYLETEATVTRSGVFNYKNADGSVRKELRHPDDVFKQDSMNSMKMIPLTDGHPVERLVNAQTAKELKVGYVGESIKVDGKFIQAPLVITDESAIKKVQNGKNQLSLGYTADVIDEKGIYNGQHYDSRQTNIRYNHLATCALARAGVEASIKLDEGDAIQLDSENEKVITDVISNNTNKEKDKNMSNITLDGIGYEASAEVINAYTKSQARIDELEKDIEAKKGVLDAQDAESEKMKEKIDSFDKTFNDSVNEAVNIRIKLFESGKSILDESVGLDSMSNQEIKKAVIKAISPDAKLDDATDAYIDARFDAALEAHASRKDVSDQRKTVNDTAKKLSTKSIVDEARGRYMNRLIGKEENKGESK